MLCWMVLNILSECLTGSLNFGNRFCLPSNVVNLLDLGWYVWKHIKKSEIDAIIIYFPFLLPSSTWVEISIYLVKSTTNPPDHPGRGQTDTDNPAEYGYIRNRIVPLGMKRIVIWTIRYPYKTLRNRQSEYPVPFYPLRDMLINYPF